MREIKFRAWDKVNRKMIVVTGINFGQPPHTPSFVLSDTDTVLFSNAEIMQFTGLKDRNGKEIWEGDVLNDPSWWWGPCAIKYVQGAVGPCRGDNVMEWRLYRGGQDIHNLWNGSEVEVIGNIYENPDF